MGPSLNLERALPVYCYTCPKCQNVQEEFRSIDQRADPLACEECASAMERDISEELGGVQTDWAEPIYSEAAGVGPEQVAQARAVNKNHEYTDDGRMIFRSKGHRKQCLKDLGMVDRDGFD